MQIQAGVVTTFLKKVNPGGPGPKREQKKRHGNRALRKEIYKIKQHLKKKPQRREFLAVVQKTQQQLLVDRGF